MVDLDVPAQRSSSCCLLAPTVHTPTETFLVIAAAAWKRRRGGRWRDRSPPRCTRARPPSCPAHHLAPRTPSLTAYKAFGRPRERNESSQDAAFLLCRVPVKHVNRDRTMRDKDSGPSGHHRWTDLSSVCTARVALAWEWSCVGLVHE